MEWFRDCTTIEDAKKRYRTLAMENHPDHGGNEETFKTIQNAFDACIRRIMFGAFDATEREHGYRPGNSGIFADVLASIVSWNITIEIIGHWIYAFDSYAYRQQLKALGFWFSKKHKAWIFSGSAKRRVRTRLTTEDVRQIHGSEVVREREQYQAIG